ncbi:hypothetical protein MIR68_002585 [Amoeboaphelidium protococcarum]|nr:hypothetical protein MIR68_002585 [Amoeboaphelidium protococcarum]
MMLLVPLFLVSVQAVSFHNVLSSLYPAHRYHDSVYGLDASGKDMMYRCSTILNVDINFSPITQIQGTLLPNYQLDVTKIVQEQSTDEYTDVEPHTRIVNECLTFLLQHDWPFELSGFKWIDQDQMTNSQAEAANSVYKVVIEIITDVLFPILAEGKSKRTRVRVQSAVDSAIKIQPSPVILQYLTRAVSQIKSKSHQFSVIGAMLQSHQDFAHDIIADVVIHSIRDGNLQRAWDIVKNYIHGNSLFEYQVVFRAVANLKRSLPQFDDFSELCSEITVLAEMNTILIYSQFYGSTSDLISRLIKEHELPPYAMLLYEELLQSREMRHGQYSVDQVQRVVQVMTEADVVQYFDTLPYNGIIYSGLQESSKLALIANFMVPLEYISAIEFFSMSHLTRLGLILGVKKDESPLSKALDIVMAYQHATLDADSIPAIDIYADKLYNRYCDSTGAVQLDLIWQEHEFLDYIFNTFVANDYLELWAYYILFKRILILYGGSRFRQMILQNDNGASQLTDFVNDANWQVEAQAGVQLEPDGITQYEIPQQFAYNQDLTFDPYFIEADMVDDDFNSPEFAQLLEQIYQ